VGGPPASRSFAVCVTGGSADYGTRGLCDVAY
jgi:hypothetical protein